MFKQHIINIFLISLLVFLAWNPILPQTFIGEGGYAYFFRRFSEKGIILTFNFGAGLLMNILVPIFKDNFFLYQSFVLVSFRY